MTSNLQSTGRVSQSHETRSTELGGKTGESASTQMYSTACFRHGGKEFDAVLGPDFVLGVKLHVSPMDKLKVSSVKFGRSHSRAN